MVQTKNTFLFKNESNKSLEKSKHWQIYFALYPFPFRSGNFVMEVEILNKRESSYTATPPYIQ